MLTKEQIDEKIVVLYEFLILRRVLGGAKIEGKRRAFKRDPKEKMVRRILETAQNENQLDIMCHDLVTGKITLDAWLSRKESAAV